MPTAAVPKVALLGSSDVEESVKFPGSALGLDYPWTHIFVGPGVTGPVVHFWTSSSISLSKRLSVNVFH